MGIEEMEDPNPEYLKEVREYLDDHKSEKLHNRVTRQITLGKDEIDS